MANVAINSRSHWSVLGSIQFNPLAYCVEPTLCTIGPPCPYTFRVGVLLHVKIRRYRDRVKTYGLKWPLKQQFSRSVLQMESYQICFVNLWRQRQMLV